MFVSALQKLRKNSKLTEKDLFAEMQKGALKAADIMPFLAEEMHNAALAGGALNKMLSGNGTALRRLSTAWATSQQQIFSAGFGDALTKLFNDLSDNLNNNSALFSGIGKFFSGIIGFANDMFNGVSDFFILSNAIINHFSQKWHTDLSTAFDMSVALGSIGLLISSFTRLSGIIGTVLKGMRTIAGFGELGAIAAGKAGISEAAGTAGKGAAAAGGGGGAGLWQTLGKIFSIGMLDPGRSAQGKLDGIAKGPRMSAYLNEPGAGKFDFSSLFTPNEIPMLPSLGQATQYQPNNMTTQAQMPIKIQQDPLKVSISVHDSEFSRVIDARLDDYNDQLINLLSTDQE
ncbi:hypothetical protein [Sodalis sp. RH19]|uniref:hypothetical protein n=1 Tax=Sodalis sp. RH19 TaxID=3394334 RepID=UPI0039B57730